MVAQTETDDIASSSTSARSNSHHPTSASGSHILSGSINSTVSPLRSLTSASGGLYVSAPGKIILFGEHAVVYGRTAVAGAIDLRTYASLFTSADQRIYLSLPDLGVEKTWMLKDLLKAGERLSIEHPPDEGPPSLEVVVPYARKLSGSCEDQCGVQHLAILAFWYLLLGVVQRKRDLMAVKVTVKFKLPACVGLGSSDSIQFPGAFCVCVATALLQTAGIIPPPTIPADDHGTMTWEDIHLDTIRRWSAAAESLIHGRASGLDAAVCTFGGVASYKPGKPIETLKNIPDLRVILVNSKVERNTTRMVQTVKDRLKKFKDVIEGIFNSIDAISKEGARILTHVPEDSQDAISLVENGDRSNTHTPLPEFDHSALQLNPNAAYGSCGGGGRSSSLSLYTAGGKRLSNASAVSGDLKERGEFNDVFSKLNDLCRMNNQLLISLGVGHPKVDQICTLLSRYGIHPKMTGAGGGGCVFAFLKPDTSNTVISMIKDELKKLDYDVWQPRLGGPGVVLHDTRPELFGSIGGSAQGSRAPTPCKR
uniref:Mevalonate kinase (inferred by orthology to a human protein) n=1 Tax=Strongyloides venezuelensis TaxID=75913 RepID=A0A0K0G033_STRVS